MYLITNQENKAFDLKNDEKRGGEEIKGAAQERIPPPRAACSCLQQGSGVLPAGAGLAEFRTVKEFSGK